MLSVTCMQTSNIEVCDPEVSNPCTVYWCVLYRKVLCTQNTHVHTALYIHIYLPYSMTQHTRSLASTNSLYLNCHTGCTYRPTIISRHNISLIRCMLSHATVRIFVTGRDLAAAPPCISCHKLFSHAIFSYIVTHFLLHASYSVTLTTVFHTTHVLSFTCTLFVTHVVLQGMEKIMETVVGDTHFFINT